MTEIVDAATLPTCPACGAGIEPGDQFCEVCGTPLGGDVGAGVRANATDASTPSGGNDASTTSENQGPGDNLDPGDDWGVGWGADGGPPQRGLAAPPAGPPAVPPAGAAGPPAGPGGRAGSGAGSGKRARKVRPANPQHSVQTMPAGLKVHTLPCVACGAPPLAIDVDGYCSVCGILQPAPRDHIEIDLGWAAGVTDRGHRHPTNQDAFRLELAGPAADGGVVAVVCDGVSSSVRAEDASDVAAAATAALLSAVVAGAGSLADATIHAASAATKAVTALTWTGTTSLGSPACTLVSAAYREGVLAVGWVGDSRAYWIDAEPAIVRQLTVDDSWAEAQVEAGRMTEVEAEADPRSHAITRWIGADAPDNDAHVVMPSLRAPGRLLICSDGLWNYAPGIKDMAQLLARYADRRRPIELARVLTEFARTSGGHDNITVVVIDFPGSTTPATTTTAPETTAPKTTGPERTGRETIGPQSAGRETIGAQNASPEPASGPAPAGGPAGASAEAPTEKGTP